MFLYRVRTRPPTADFSSHNSLWTTFRISFILGMIDDLDLYIANLIRFWLWPWPWIFKVKYGICYISAKTGPVATKWKANLSIELYASNGTIRFDLGHDLDLEFSRSNMEFAISQLKMVLLPQNKNQTYQLNSRPQMGPLGLTFAMTLTLNFQGQISNLLYLSQKWLITRKWKANISIEL